MHVSEDASDMSETYSIERQIEFDAGHRVTFHGSKCKNLHGHRYRVVALCQGPLVKSGEQQGMVMDFGFLKDEMLREIHDDCDHSLILWWEDPIVQKFVDTSNLEKEIKSNIVKNGYYKLEGSIIGAIYLMSTVPTAENLAAHWFIKLAPRISERSSNQVKLRQIKVYETPNCMAAYPV